MNTSLISGLPWAEITSSLWAHGYGRLGPVLGRTECEALRALYSDPRFFCSRMDTARFRLGRGEYQYFAYPPLVAARRESLYHCLAGTANEWMAALSLNADLAPELKNFLAHGHARGQKRPTPLLLRYVRGDFNRLHQDLHGDRVFPFQVISCLCRLQEELTGGIAAGGAASAQSVGYALSLKQGEAVGDYHAIPSGPGITWALSHKLSPRREPDFGRGALHPGDRFS